jgi:small redox-active disulfide protein 2
LRDELAGWKGFPFCKYHDMKDEGGEPVEIKILGTGCPKCKALEKNTREALEELGITAEIEKVTQINKIMEYDIMYTPGLVVNGEVKSSGKVLDKEDIKKILAEAQR